MDGVIAIALELSFKRVLHKLAERSTDPIAEIDEVERELLAAIKNATPDPQSPAHAYLAVIEAQTAVLNKACANVRRAFGGV